MNEERGPTDVEITAAALREASPVPPATKTAALLLDWRLWGALASVVAIGGLVLASVLFYRDSQQKDDTAACRAETAALLRDADSEVIRQTAIFKEAEGGVSQGLAAMVVTLSRQQPITPATIDQLDRAQAALLAAKAPLDGAIQAQNAAREENLAIIAKCGSS